MTSAKLEEIKLTLDNVLEEGFVIVEKEPSGFQGLMHRIMGDVTTASVGKQVLIGGATGCAAGYLTNKVGRLLGISVAGAFILFQVAQHKGYIRVDWTKVKRAMTKAKAEARLEALKLRQASAFGQIQSFAEDNFYLSSGFAGGFALGFFGS